MTSLSSLVATASNDASIKLQALTFACAITAGLLTFVLIVAFVLVNAKVRRVVGGFFVDPRSAPVERFLAYAGSAILWPVALVMTVVYLKKPDTARFARVCFGLFVGQILVITYATCVGMFLFGSAHPELLP